MTSCDDVSGPACVASTYSTAGQGANFATRTPDVLSDGAAAGIQQARTTPDGHHLLYRAQAADNTLQLHVFDADTNASPVCVSCDPTGAPSTSDPTLYVRANIGGSAPTWHESHALSDDGSRAFFSTAQPLAAGAVNGKVNVYEWTMAGTHDCPASAQARVNGGCLSLISAGTGSDDSWFMDGSASGDDVFFTTRDQLVGADVDSEFDVYDARVDGGLPGPPPPATPCTGDPCQGALSSSPGAQPAASAAFTGPGNVITKLKPRTTAACRRGYLRKNARSKHRARRGARRAHRR